MSLQERRARQNRVYAGIAIFLAVIMGVSLILPLLSQNVATNTATIPPTATPRPTVPAPITDLSSIQFDDPYLHPSGLFTAVVPTGFVVTSENSTTGEALATMRNGQQLGVVELRVVRPVQGQDIASAQGLSEIFNEGWLRDSWREYTSWEEDARRLQDDDSLLIDFSLERSGQDFIARQIAFADDQWVYTVRVVTPSNASAYLRHILDTMRERFQPIERYVGSPIEWTSYFDTAGAYLIRYPSTWQVTDSVTGGPTSITADGVALLVDTQDFAVDSAEAAAEWVAQARPGVEVLSAQAVDQFGTAGYQVAYQVETIDGDLQSGLALLLVGADATYTANLLLTDAGALDLSADDVPAEYADAVEAVRTFSLLPELRVASSVPAADSGD